MRTSSITLGLATWLFGAAAMAADCGGVDQACEVPMGSYHIAMPEGVDGAVPAVIFLHGAGGTGAREISNDAMRNGLLSRGYALIAPNGMGREGRGGGFWSFIPGREILRDENAFLDEVAADAAQKFGVDRDRIVLSGFSIGGSMTSYAACAQPDQFSAYAPVAGSFWRPHPAECTGPVRLLHTHGWTDGTVPLEGRPLRGGAINQGDVFHGMSIWRAANGCDAWKADRFEMTESFWHRRWVNCNEGTALEFVLFPGGHGVPRGWSQMMLDWYEGL
ncbi:polyhydroxybutyrate depolymerase [Actibacterium mucosum KCTC 23349]|uniref:Polyhydroxybutyrate depolymerase n=1 Tax=Actibacterium mucosum KCTC 23349 TaxID=1454373 RepID=A0A037ZJD4_9RHOB|nr:prolyl oligopeptidase family serine peptidase [Actibacterium mucosum]KAJ56223.1 polyhydroxybutyrate depolymerase [Actibacterium mucosum KCTC 23349]